MRSIFSLFLLISSILYFGISFNFEFLSNGVPGSGFLPGITGIVLVLLTGYNFINEKRTSEGKESYEKNNLIDMLKLIIITIFYVFLFNIIGSLVSTLLFTIITLLIINRNKWKQNIVMGFVVTIVVFLMFDYLLNTHLPKGIFENII